MVECEQQCKNSRSGLKWGFLGVEEWGAWLGGLRHWAKEFCMILQVMGSY